DGLADMGDGLRDIERRIDAGRRAVGEIVPPRPCPPFPPARVRNRRQGGYRPYERARPRMDRQARLVDAPELLRPGEDKDERLSRHGRLEQRVAARRHLAETVPD